MALYGRIHVQGLSKGKAEANFYLRDTSIVEKLSGRCVLRVGLMIGDAAL